MCVLLHMHKIEEIPNYIRIKEGEENQYILCGIIRYEGNTATVGHYTAVCRRPNGIWEEFDGLAKRNKIHQIKVKK
ncbi:hypothetical protein PUN28_003606 [Cardiocondyla obscurior]|uniref:Peptidase C19 ubiquitin carboxyl-terminal hydrolase domain-containing protein n=1 Tax=Cardiocondyla obscurior TaxID=286306 RepID=A0AAW2GNY6_9HYME